MPKKAKATRVVRKPKAKKPLSLRQVLNVIDVALLRQDDIARQLWDVMTALRGPDKLEQADLKGTSTCHVRRNAFPKTTKWVDAKNYGNIIGASFHGNLEVKRPTANWDHFSEHTRSAMDVLGIVEVSVEA